MSIPAAALALVALVLPAAAQPLRPALKQARGGGQLAGFAARIDPSGSPDKL